MIAIRASLSSRISRYATVDAAIPSVRMRDRSGAHSSELCVPALSRSRLCLEWRVATTARVSQYGMLKIGAGGLNAHHVSDMIQACNSSCSKSGGKLGVDGPASALGALRSLECIYLQRRVRRSARELQTESMD